MSQLSFFAADVAEPTVFGLGGLLATHGQITTDADGSRLSILLSERWRADAVRLEFDRRGLTATVTETASTGPDDASAASSWLVRSARSPDLNALAAGWTRGAVKTVPPFPNPPGELLRCWALAAGQPDPAGYLLGADPHASQTYPRLAASLAAVGLAAAVLGARGGGPGMRIVGRRRLERLAELIGEPPAHAPAGAFPVGR